ncbi:transporter substrate-binding protein [Mesorhizobium atlanticum]
MTGCSGTSALTEGFEANENVIYTGACPNQHLIPLFDHMLPRYGKARLSRRRQLCLGLGDEPAGAASFSRVPAARCSASRYLPIEETDVGLLIADLERHRPDCILNNMIGPSSYAFLAAVRRLADRDPPSRRNAARC